MPLDALFKDIVFIIDRDSNNQIHECKLNFSLTLTKTITACSALYIFFDGAPIKVGMVSKFLSAQSLYKRALMPLDNLEPLYNYALAFVNQSAIFLTGGSRANFLRA